MVRLRRGVDGLFSLSRHRALATAGLDTCGPLPVKAAAADARAGRGKTPRGPSREILAAEWHARAARVCEGLGRVASLSRGPKSRRGCQ